MAKKQETKKEVVVETPVVETPPVVKQPEVRERLKPSNEWEIKDRVYYLKSRQKPLSKLIKSTNIFWFDEEK